MIDEQQFLGVLDKGAYTVLRDYIDTEAEQIRLYRTRYLPKDEPKFSICIIHGFGEHSGRYHHVAQYFAERGFDVFMVDLRGFGFSGGPRVLAEFRQFENEVICLLRTVRSDLPMFLYGHSMGGLLIVKLLLDKSQINVSGCILTSPALGINQDLGFDWGKQQSIKLIGDPLGDMTLTPNISPTSLTKDVQQLKKYFDDHLVVPITTLKLGKYLFSAIDDVANRRNTFSFPILILHGKKDRAINYKFSEQFIYSKVRPFKELILFPQGLHELHNDSECDEMLHKITDFISRIPKKNFGLLAIQTIPKPKPSKNSILKIISLLIFLTIILKKLKIFPFRK